MGVTYRDSFTTTSRVWHLTAPNCMKLTFVIRRYVHNCHDVFHLDWLRNVEINVRTSFIRMQAEAVLQPA